MLSATAARGVSLAAPARSVARTARRSLAVRASKWRDGALGAAVGLGCSGALLSESLCALPVGAIAEGVVQSRSMPGDQEVCGALVDTAATAAEPARRRLH